MAKELLKIKHRKEEARVVAPYFFQYYNKCLERIKELMPEVPRWNIPNFPFPDGTPSFHIEPESGTTADLSKLPIPTIAPMWYLPSDDATTAAIIKVGSALTHTEKGRKKPLSKKIIAMCLYAMLRQDGDSVDPDTGVRSIGQAIYSEIFANIIKDYYSDLVILDPHSDKAMKYQKIPHISVTATPLFVDWFKEKYSDEKERKKVKLVALDKGSLQRCLKFAELAGLDVKTQVVVLNKKRNGFKLSGEESDFLYGDPKDADIIIFDDMIDTSGSMEQTCKALKKRGCGDITVMATHGVLSHPARSNIKTAIEKGVIKNIVITNSLPQADYGLDGITNVTILDVVPLMVSFAELVANSSINDVLKNFDKEISQFIMEPEDKEKIWRHFAKKVGLSSK